MNYPNYRDFYQKALIPIGLTDRSALAEANHSELPPFTTHWLITLEGESVSQPKEYYNWKVRIYPSDAEGTFDWNNAYFTSPLMDSFNKAIELSRTVESYSKKDQLLSSNLQQKIS